MKRIYSPKNYLIVIFLSLLPLKSNASYLDIYVPREWSAVQNLSANFPQTRFIYLHSDGRDRYSGSEYIGEVEGDSYVIFSDYGNSCSVPYFSDVLWFKDLSKEQQNVYNKLGIEKTENYRSREWYVGRVAKVKGVKIRKNQSYVIVQFKDGKHGQFQTYNEFNLRCMFNVDRSIYTSLD